jgi:hypothetical protein
MNSREGAGFPTAAGILFGWSSATSWMASSCIRSCNSIIC